MTVHCIWEHNGNDTLLYADDFPGAFTRGETKEEAISKMEREIRSYMRWCEKSVPNTVSVEIIQEKASDLNIRDADSDVIFDSEQLPLSKEEYTALKALAIRAAMCFQSLYDAVPDKNKSDLPNRKTFYGDVPRTAQEMYDHTKNVNAYYFGEIEVDADNNGNISDCRRRGFEILEGNPDFLNLPVFNGSYGEKWSVRKVIRRFIWHDRIHAKALYRMITRIFGENSIQNTFCFDL